MKQRLGLMMIIIMATAAWATMAFASPTHLPSIGNVKHPGRIAIDTQGNQYVTGREGLLFCNAQGACKAVIRKDGLFAIAVDQDGRIYAGSERKKAVLVYNPDFTFSHNLGAGAVEFDRPSDIAVDGAGRIYVVDSLKNMVSVFESTGALAFSFGGSGDGNGMFHYPTALAINDASAEIYVTDRQTQSDGSSGARIQVFDKSGGFKRAIGKSGTHLGEITVPVAIAVDSATGKLYVSDAYQNAVLIVDPATGAITTALYDLTPGRAMAMPQGVVIGKNGIVYVASANGNSIERYGLDGCVTMDTTPASLTFVGTQFGSAPALQTLTIANNGSGSVTWTAAKDQAWLLINGQTATVSGSTGPSASSSLTAAVDISNLAPGSYKGNITLSSDRGLVTVIPVSLTILPPPTVSLSRDLFLFAAIKNQSAPAQAVTVAVANAADLPWTVSSDAAWLSMTPAAGNATTNSALSISTAGLATGSYTGHITVSAPGAVGNGIGLTVNLTIQPATKITVATNVANAAFTITGPATYSGTGQSWSVEDAASGSYSIVYAPVQGYQKPSDQTLPLATTGEIVFTGTYISDAVGPVLSLSTLADGSYTNNGTLNLVGKVTDNLTLDTVTVNGAVVTVNADGTFSQAVLLGAGANLITTIATDMAGNATTDARTIVLDQTAPVITVSSPSDNSVTNAADQTVAGMMDKSGTVSVQVNDVVSAATMTGNSFSLPVSLAYGQNTIQVTATDLAGNFGTVKRTVILDNINPTLSVTSPVQDITVNQPGLLLQGTVADLTGTTVTITLDGIDYMPAVTDGVFQQQLVFSTEKMYALLIKASDAAGNTTTVQRNVIYSTADSVSLYPLSLSFGNQRVNTASAAQTVTVTNTGTGYAKVRVKSIRIGGANHKQFEQTNDCPARLAPNASCTVSVVFKPNVVKQAISSNLIVNGVSVALSGTGTKK